MTTQAKWACELVLAALSVSSLSCGRSDLPELGTVRGTVTMDGKPLAGVTVQFYPGEGGRPGSGVTDSKGEYVVAYTHGVNGAPVGDCKVEITTMWPDGEPGPGQKETVPPKYNSLSTLKETVKSGSNTFDFALESAAR